MRMHEEQRRVVRISRATTGGRGGEGDGGKGGRESEKRFLANHVVS